MSRIKKAWHFLLSDSYKWIFYCIFQPRRFNRNLEQVGIALFPDLGQQVTRWKLALQILKLGISYLLPIYLSIYSLLFLSYIIGNFGILISLAGEGEAFIKEGGNLE